MNYIVWLYELKSAYKNAYSISYSTSLTGSENHLASFRFQNTFLLNAWNRNGDRWFSDPVSEVLKLDKTCFNLLNQMIKLLIPANNKINKSKHNPIF
jgi:hypothetical protein